MVDVNWSYGPLVTPETPPEPEGLGSDDTIAALLDAAEDVVNAAAPDVIADIEAEHRKQRRRLKGRANVQQRQETQRQETQKGSPTLRRPPPGWVTSANSGCLRAFTF